jgi:hypothetical protein
MTVDVILVPIFIAAYPTAEKAAATLVAEEAKAIRSLAIDLELRRVFLELLLKLFCSSLTLDIALLILPIKMLIILSAPLID